MSYKLVKNRYQAGITPLIVLVVLTIASAAVVGGGNLLKSFLNNGYLNVDLGNLNNLVYSQPDYLNAKKVTGSTFDSSVVGTVVLSDGSYSAYRFLDGEVKDNGGSFGDEVKIEFLSGDMGLGTYSDGTIVPFYLTDGTKTFGIVMNRMVANLIYNDGVNPEGSYAIKILQGSVNKGKLVGDFVGQTYETGYIIAGNVDDSGHISKVSVTSGAARATEAETSIAGNALTLFKKIAMVESPKVLAASTTSYQISNFNQSVFDSKTGRWSLPASSGSSSTAASQSVANYLQQLSQSGTPGVQTGTQGGSGISSPSTIYQYLPVYLQSPAQTTTTIISGIKDVQSATSNLKVSTSNGVATLSIDFPTTTTNTTVTVPDNSITSAKVVDYSINAQDLSPQISFMPYQLLDLSAVSYNSAAPQGLRLPMTTSANPAHPYYGKGYLAWDSVNNKLIAYDGSNWVSIGSGSGGGGGGSTSLSENNTVVVPSLGNLNLSGTDFSITPTSSTSATISVDYTNSNIVRSNQTQSISGAWTFNNGITLGTDTITDINGSGLSLTSGVLRVSGLTTSNFASPNISQFTNNASYLTSTGSAAYLTNFPTLNQNTTGTASNITGVLGASSFPALTGNVTNSQGSLVTTVSGLTVSNFTSNNISQWNNDSNYITGLSWGQIGGTLANQTDLTAALNAKANTSSLGTAAFTASSAYATSAQGTLATNALPSASFTDSAVTGKLITGYVSGAGMITPTDTILSAIQKLNGNYANDYRSNNFVAGTNYLAPNGSAASLTNFPTFNQNTTGTASNITGVLGSSSFPALTGDVTNTQGNLSTTIANGVVTLAKMANMATASFLGRNTTGTGVPEVLSVATVKTMLSLGSAAYTAATDYATSAQGTLATNALPSTSFTDTAVTGKLLTGYVSGTGMIAATDTILQAIQKLNGNDATNANLTGVVTSVGNATSIAAGAITNTMLANSAVANLSGTNTGDNAVNSTYTSDYRAANFVAGTNYLAPSGSAASLTNFPTLNQSTTGNALTATTATTANALASSDAAGQSTITAINSATTGTINAARLNSAVTTQGNTFNGVSQLVKLDTSGNLPAINGSALTGVTVSWGAITGTLSNQSDLQAALNAKANSSSLGTLSTQNSNSVTITGGTLSGLTSVGATTFTGALTGNASTVTGFSPTSGKVLSLSNSLTLVGTDASTLNIGSGGTLGTAAYSATGAFATAAQGTLATNALPSSSFTDSAVSGKLITGYVSGAGTVVATDSILQAIQKLNGNDATNANLTGVVTSTGNATSIAAGAITNTMLANSAVANLSGTNTGDNSANSTYASDYRAANFVAGTNYLTPTGSAASLTSFPTLNQNTTGTAAGLSVTLASTSGGSGVNNAGTLTWGAGGTLGTAAYSATGAFATAAQGTLATNALPSTSFTDSAVSGKLITGYVSGAGTVAATDTILQAIQKLNGNDATNANLTGVVTSVGNATSIAAGAITNTMLANGAVANLSGTNTGDNATNSNYSSDYRAANFVAGTNYLTPTGSAASLTSFPTFNQSTTGTAAGLSAILVSTSGGSGINNAGTLTWGSGGTLGTAAYTPTTNYATAAQGTLATNALPTASFTDSAVSGKLITGFTSGAGTVAATDSILQAIQKLNGNDATNANLTGVVTSVGNATSIAAGAITNTMLANGAVANLSGTNTGDNSANSTYASDYRAANFVAGTNYLTPTGSAASLTSFPTLNQNTSGTAAGLSALLVSTSGGSGINNAGTLTWGAGGTLGSAAYTASSTYATAAQGTLATNALPSASFTDSAVSGKLITGYVSGAGTIAATDTILQAIQKLNGNDATNANLTGVVTSVGNATSIANGAITNAMLANGAVANLSGTNTGDNAVNSTYASDYRAANFVAGTNYLTPTGSAASLTSFPIFNQNTTGTSSNITGVLGASSFPAMLGDVTNTQGSLTNAIAAGAVTLTKMANLASYSIIGNNTGSATTPVALSKSDVKTLLAITNGDISGLGTMSTQNAGGVSITGGSAAGLTGFGIRSSGTGAFDLTIANSENLTAGRTLTITLGNTARTLTLTGDASITGTNTGDNATNSQYASDYRSGNFVAGTNYLTPSGSAASLTNFPTFNQNTTGTAAGLSVILSSTTGGSGINNAGTLTWGAGGTLGSAAYTASSAYATAAQGTLATNALPSASFTDAAVSGKLITGYVSGAGTVAATDSILQAIQKLNGNDATNANLTGVVTSVGNATSIANGVITNVMLANGAVANLSGTNTGDNAANSTYASDYRAANFVAGTNYLTPTGSAASLTSFPTFNQNTTGTAAGLSVTLVSTSGGSGVNNAGTLTWGAGGTLGTAAYTPSSNYATSAQGTLATNALPSTSFTDSAVSGKLITGYVSGAGTVAATDSILQAIQKLNGNEVLDYDSANFVAGTNYLTPTGSGASLTGITGDQVLPAQTGNNGKVLGTNGTTVSWVTNSSGVAWGAITGTLSNQTDLNTALNAKANSSSLGTLSTQNSNSVSITGGSLSGLTSVGATTFTGALTGNASSVTGLSVTSGKTLSISKTMTFTSADDTGVYTLPTGTATLLATNGSAAGLTSFPTFNQNTTGTASNITGVLGASSFPALTGDVTTTQGSLATTIAANAVALTTDTTGNYVAGATANGGLSLTGTEGGTLGITLPAAADGLSSTTSSGSGLELLSGGLTLLQGCSDGQILKWNETTDVWACQNDLTSAGGGIATVKEGGTNIVTSATALNFAANDFAITDETGGQAGIAIDYATSGISRKGQADTVTGGWTFNTNVTTFTTAINANGGISTAAGTALALTSGNNGSGAAGNITLDVGTSSAGNGSILIGNAGRAQTITIGNSTGATAINLISGSGTINLQPGGTSATGTVQIGAGGSGSGTPDILKLDVKNDSITDPTGTNGSMYYNSSSAKFRCYENGAWKNCDTTGGGTLFEQTATKAVANTTTETTLVSSGTGSVTLPANFFTAGKSIRVTASGFYGTTSTAPTLTMKVYLGATAIAASGANTITASQSNKGWSMSTIITCYTTGASGTVWGQGGLIYTTGTSPYVINAGMVDSSAVTVNTTATQAVDVKVTWGTGNSSNTITATNLAVETVSTTGSDLAEVYYTNDSSIEPGDVVRVDNSINAGVAKTMRAYDPQTLGVISTKPGLVLGDMTILDNRPVFLALSGRVPVKVSGENGPILPGDTLTASSNPGVAMKATKAGPTIGQALTSYDGEGTGTVVVLVNNAYSYGSSLALLVPENQSFDNGAQILTQLMSSKDSIKLTDISEMFTDRLAASLEIISPRGLFDGLEVNTIKSLGDAITFNSDTVFFGRPYFNSDTAGFAVIKQGDNEVTVNFDKEYLANPVVNASPLWDTDQATLDVMKQLGTYVLPKQDYIIVNSNTKGFSIVLDKPAVTDLKFSWIALAVKGARTVLSASIAAPIPTLSPTQEPTPTPIPLPSEGPVATPVPTETPMPAPTPSPSATPLAPQTITVLSSDLGYVRLRDTPSTDGNELDHVPTGTILSYTNMENGWYQVTYNGQNGWISGIYVSNP